MGAALVSIRASRMRRHGELLLSSLPKPLDEAIADVRRSGAPVAGVFRGRLGSEEEVTSPGGVVCAFYESEIRQPSGRGRRGPLLTSERGYSETLWLRGELGEAMLTFSPKHAIGRHEAHRCTVLVRLTEGRRALASRPTPVEAVSFERLGRKGDICLVAGELRPGRGPGSYEVRGPGGGPATVILGEEVVDSGRSVLQRSWRAWATAALLCVVAAGLLA
ncbi:MAG: hypothetical protein WBV82_05695 [Myxococcaceae bacterium]